MRTIRRIPSSEIALNGLRMKFDYPKVDTKTDPKVLVGVLEKKIVEARLRLGEAKHLKRDVLENARANIDLAQRKLDNVLKRETEHDIAELHHAIQIVDRVLQNIEKAN